MTAPRRMTERPPESPPGDLFLVRKPKGWTSFDVVNRIRRASGIRKVGHAGTLDPMATGLLVVCTGRKTRELAAFAGLDKEYRVTMRLGERTPSQDADTPVCERRSLEGLTEQALRRTLAAFVGERRQTPPMYSAVKVQGRRLYEYARKGIEIERAERSVTIHRLTLLAFEPPEATFTVACSKGTYVRALVEEIGLALGCGAHVTALERTRIGDYRVEDAVPVEDLARMLAERSPA